MRLNFRNGSSETSKCFESSLHIGRAQADRTYIWDTTVRYSTTQYSTMQYTSNSYITVHLRTQRTEKKARATVYHTSQSSLRLANSVNNLVSEGLTSATLVVVMEVGASPWAEDAVVTPVCAANLRDEPGLGVTGFRTISPVWTCTEPSSATMMSLLSFILSRKSCRGGKKCYSNTFCIVDYFGSMGSYPLSNTQQRFLIVYLFTSTPERRRALLFPPQTRTEWLSWQRCGHPSWE